MKYYFYKYHFIGILIMHLLACHPTTSFVNESDSISINYFDSNCVKDSVYLDLFQEITFHYKFGAADSILSKNIKNAIIHNDYDALKIAYTQFFLLPDLSEVSEFTQKYSEDAMDHISKEGDLIIDWNLTYALFKYFLAKADAKKSMELASKLQEKSINLAIPECTALTSLALGEAHDLNGSYKFAIRNLFTAHSQISNSNRLDIKRHIICGISKFYQDHYMYENALTYKAKELELYSPNNILDTVQYFHTQLDYQDIMATSDDEKIFNLEQVLKIIQYAKTYHCIRLYEYATAFLRTTLVNSDNTDDLNQYFKSLSIEEVKQLQTKSPSIFFLLSAKDFESKKQLNKAKEMYENALVQLEGSPSHDRKSYFHLQFAKFLDRNDKVHEAITQFEQAVDYAKMAQNQEFELKASLAADAFYSKHNNPAAAYNHLKNYYRLMNAKSATARDQDVYKMEILTEQKILDDNKILEDSYLERYNQVQYNLIAIFIFSVFIVLLVSVRFKVPIWFIRVLGYIGVVFVFEFCIIQIDHFIHEVTHNTPWKIFTIKVIIISIILPLHHTIEKKLIKFLIIRRESDENLIKISTNFIKTWFKKLDSTEDTHD